MTVGGAIGILAAFIQTLEKIQLLKNANEALVCDLNSVFSCTNVLNAWQSSVFGFPNSMMCMVLFTIFFAIGLAGWSGAKLPKGLRLGIHGLSLFTLGFGLWFLWASTYQIGALCLYCVICMTGLLMVNWAWLRLNAADLPIGKAARAKLAAGIAKGADTFGWILLAVTIAFLMILRFS